MNKQNKSNTRRKKQWPIAWCIVIDVFIAALALFVFSLYYFILPTDLSQHTVDLPVPSDYAEAFNDTPKSAEPAPSAAQTAPQTTGSPGVSETPADTSAWGAKFPGKFTDGKVEKDKYSYKSANVSINIQKEDKDGVVYFVADVYVKDLKYFKTALARDKFGKGLNEPVKDMAKRHKAVLAVNGDFYSLNAGPVVRNGKMNPSRDKGRDVLVMKYDGTMQTFTKDEFDLDKSIDEGLYQLWQFGPMLLKDGKPMEDFNTTDKIKKDTNPRTAVGYYEPGHYCLVVVDGRQPRYSDGIGLKELSKIFYDLGCKAAFNMDGGESSEMVFNGKTVNTPFENGRDVSDIILITDE